MGQWTHGIMWGVKKPTLPANLSWWTDHDLDIPGILEELEDLEDGEGIVPFPSFDDDGTVLGCFVAIGRSALLGGHQYPYLEGAIDMENIEGNPSLQTGIRAAKEAFERFASFLDRKGISVDQPNFWLVEIEVL